ncbi:MAG TPA: hypothetical protein VFU12_04085 [Glycomyces sp.]|nr:hypothetical protein [Glycomyces sp.]
MANVLNTATVRPQRWSFRAITTTAVVTAVMVMSTACTEPEEGALSDNPTLATSESTAPELMFVPQIPEDICPTEESIPDELAAPENIGYIDESGPGTTGTMPYHRCGYLLNGEVAALAGTQVTERIHVDFHITDGSPQSVRSRESYSPVDFGQVGAAQYFRDWDQMMDKSELDVSPTGQGMEESYYLEFQSFASIDNLYVYAYISFVVTDEDHDMEPDLDTDEAAYQILEAIVAPVVAELERQ